ncbi:MAG: hypothetical protein AAF747_06200, partial [Planctomycetota bacterium]
MQGPSRRRITERLLSGSGRAALARDRRGEWISTLEQRMLLDGAPDLPNFAGAVAVPIGAGGVGTIAEPIDTVGDGDLFTFSVTNTDFIRVLADADKPGGQTLQQFNERVDTRLEIFNSSQQLIFTSSDSGNLTPAIDPTEAFVGFVPSGEDFVGGVATYFVRVTSDQTVGPTATGPYTLRIDTQSEGTFPAVNPAAPAAVTQGGTLTTQLEDTVFVIQTGGDVRFNSLVTVSVPATPANPGDPVIDTRVDIYDASGTLIAEDSLSGLLTNAFATFDGAPNETYYVRVRSDEFAPGSSFNGAFGVVAEVVAAPLALPVDPVRRLGFAGGGVNAGLTSQFRFTAQGTGPAIISLNGTGLAPVSDPTLRLFDSSGALLATSTDVFGQQPEIVFNVVGGDEYFVLIDAFVGTGAQFLLQVESNAVLPFGFSEVDDHAGGTNFEDATPIVFDWGNSAPAAPALPLAGTEPATPAGTAVPTGSVDAAAQYNPMMNDWAFLPLGDTSEVLTGRASGRLSAADDDLFVFVPPVDMLGQFEGREDPTDGRFWQLTASTAIPAGAAIRPSSRLEVQVRPYPVDEIDPFAPPISFFTNPIVEIIELNPDGTFNILNGSGTGGFFNNGAPIATPAGVRNDARYQRDFDFPMTDPLQPVDAADDVQLWGGRPYYIRVRGGGEGRYNLTVRVDNAEATNDPALPPLVTPFGDFAQPDNQGSIVLDGGGNPVYIGFEDSTVFGPGVPAYSGYKETANGGFGTATVPPTQFPAAVEVQLDSVTGDGTATTAANSIWDRSSGFERAIGFDGAVVDEDPSDGSLLSNPFPVTAGITYLYESDGYAIENPQDTDLFFIVASRDGTADVRINTSNLNDSFTYSEVDAVDFAAGNSMMPDTASATLTDTYNSLLDSRLRIYNRDLELIFDSQQTTALVGTSSQESIGSLGTFTFNERDARAVFDVQAGEVYYIEVLSGQADEYEAYLAAPNNPVNWTNLVGSYELLVSTTPANAAGPGDGDDFGDADTAFTVLLPLDQQVSSTLPIDSSGNISISGVIDDSVFNPSDNDLLDFIAPATSTVTLTVSQSAGSSVLPSVTLFSRLGLVGNAAATLSSQVVASSDGIATLTFDVTKGDRVFILIEGTGGTEGAYDVSVSGLLEVDDHADEIDFEDGSTLTLLDFAGSVSVNGSIESNGDSDVFVFQPQDFTLLRADVAAESLGDDFTVEIFEVQVDSAGNAFLASVTAPSDEVTAPTTPDRIATQIAPGPQSYPLYYLVVRGADDLVTEG